jgi:serine/threonine protein kinase
VEITDSGIAWSASSVPLTKTGQVLGTPQCLSSEQANGAPATPASDVHALGGVAYQCLSGRLPFDAESPVQVVLMQMRDQPPPNRSIAETGGYCRCPYGPVLRARSGHGR